MRKAQTHYYKLLAIVIVLSLLACLYPLRNGVRINNSLDVWFVHSDTVYEEYIDFRNRYSNDEVVAIYVRSGDVFTPDVMGRMIAMCNQIDSLAAVQSVFSIANAPFISSTLMGPTVVPLVRVAPKLQLEADAIRVRAGSVPHYRTTLLDKTQEGFMVYAMLKEHNPAANADKEAVDEIKSIVYSHFSQAHFGGIPVINHSLNQAASSESVKLSGLSFVAVVVFLMLFLRSWRYVLISVLSVTIPICWVMGGFTAWGGSFNMITVVVPSLLLITGTATSIHIVNICHRFYLQGDCSARQALGKALAYVFWPCFFTATTTMAGFASLVVSPIQGIREAGVLAAVGVGLVFVCSFAVVSVAFVLFPPAKRVGNSNNLWTQTDWLLHRLNAINRRAPWLALSIFPIGIVLSTTLFSKVEVKSHALDYLPRSSKAYIDNAIIEQHVGPFLPVEMLVTNDTTFNAEQLRCLQTFQQRLKRSGVVANVFSPIDVIGYLNTAVFGSKTQGLPFGDGSVEWLKNQYLRNRRGSLQKYDNDDFTELRISSNTYIGSTLDYKLLTDSISHIFKESVPQGSGLKLSIRGYLPMYVAMNSHIVSGQINTFALAFVLIISLIIICFKSVKLAIVALVPNLFPIAMVVVFMFAFGIPIDQSTALITCIILGVAFDDSIHLIYAFRSHKRLGLPNAAATLNALNTTASAMISTSIALLAGFLVIATTSTAGLNSFGILCAIAVVASLLGNIWLFPLLLGGGRRK